MKKSLIALAFGTLGLGIAEFTMMGILPYVARDLNISIPVAGHFISAYALGVCAGAPMLIVARKRPLKHILLVLMALMLVGNLGAATGCCWQRVSFRACRMGHILELHLLWQASWRMREKARKPYPL